MATSIDEVGFSDRAGMLLETTGKTEFGKGTSFEEFCPKELAAIAIATGPMKAKVNFESIGLVIKHRKNCFLRSLTGKQVFLVQILAISDTNTDLLFNLAGP